MQKKEITAETDFVTRHVYSFWSFDAWSIKIFLLFLSTNILPGTACQDISWNNKLYF